jgi:hypothetical protein
LQENNNYNGRTDRWTELYVLEQHLKEDNNYYGQRPVLSLNTLERVDNNSYG